MRIQKYLGFVNRTSLIIVAIFSFLGIGVFAIAAGNVPKDIVQRFSEMKFGEKGYLNGTTTISSVLLRGDPLTEGGRAVVLTRLTKGMTNTHFHTFDEDVFMLKGTVIHVVAALPDSRTRELEAGSYWYVPAGSVHHDRCLTDECIYLVVIGGKGETTVVKDSP